MEFGDSCIRLYGESTTLLVYSLVSARRRTLLVFWGTKIHERVYLSVRRRRPYSLAIIIIMLALGYLNSSDVQLGVHFRRLDSRARHGRVDDTSEIPASRYNAAAPGTPSSPGSLPPQPCAAAAMKWMVTSVQGTEKYIILPHNSHSQRSLGLKPFPDEARRVLDQDRRELHRIPKRLVVWRPVPKPF